MRRRGCELEGNCAWQLKTSRVFYDARNGARRVRVRLTNIAVADETDVDCHSPLISGMGYAIQKTVMKCKISFIHATHWRRYEPMRATLSDLTPDFVLPLCPPHEDFLHAIEANTAPICDGLEGRRSLALVEAIYRLCAFSSNQAPRMRLDGFR